MQGEARQEAGPEEPSNDETVVAKAYAHGDHPGSP
jgi:hypothetical protein